jgi:hypothetical protein
MPLRPVSNPGMGGGSGRNVNNLARPAVSGANAPLPSISDHGGGATWGGGDSDGGTVSGHQGAEPSQGHHSGGGGSADLNRGATNRGRGGGGQTAQTAAPSGSLGHPSMHNNGSALMAEAIVADGGDRDGGGFWVWGLGFRV